jgi:hypothetical protein
MASQINAGTTAAPFPPGFAFSFPARVDDHTHLDAHVGCTGNATYEVWVLVYYELVSPDAVATLR